jgi:hypothetical protein
MASNNSKIWELMGITASTGEGTYKNRMGLGNAITRDNGIPLDLSSLHDTFNDAVVYAATKGIAYVGQILAAGDTVYVLTEQSQGKQKITSYRDSITGKLVTLEEETEYDVYLKPVGIIPTGSEYITVDEDGKITYTGPIYTADGKTMEIGEGNVLRIAGSENAQAGTLPVLETVEGKTVIVWKTLEDIGAGDGNSVTEVASGCPCIEVEDEAEEGFEGHKYKVSLNISAEEGNQVVEKKDGVYVAPPKLVDYTVTVTTENLETDNLKHYIFSQLGKEIAHIDIPKDLVVESGTVEVKTEAGAWGEAGTYIVLVIANQDAPIYVNAKDLVDVYTVADTATVDMTITGTEIKADVKISAEAGNLLEAKEDGLYVKHDLPTSADAVVANQYVTSVDQKDGKVTVTRKQISYNELADLPTIPGTPDFGVLALTGEKAIVVENKSETETQDKVVKLLIDETNRGNVVLTQSDAGLKAEVDLSEYAKTTDIPTLVYTDDNKAATKAANTGLAIANLTVEGHTITEVLGEFVSASVIKDGAVENGGGLIDPTKTYAEQIVWVATEDGRASERQNVPTTLDQVLVLATAETVNVGEGEDTISYRTGHAGLMTPEEKFKLEKLVIDEDGSVGISGTISAENVIGLSDVIEGMVPLKGVNVNGTPLTIAANKTVDIPLATAEKLGVVKSAQNNADGKVATNKVYIDENGIGEVKEVGVDKLTNIEGFELVLNGGNATGKKANA